MKNVASHNAWFRNWLVSVVKKVCEISYLVLSIELPFHIWYCL